MPVKEARPFWKKAIRVSGFALSILFLLVLVIFFYGVYDRGLHQHEYLAYPFPQIGVELPKDHAAHPDYKTEWWYYTGHLFDENGNRYGFELTFFRIRTVNMWYIGLPVWWFLYPNGMSAHMAITDAKGKKFYYTDIIQKNSSDDVGAKTDVFDVWLRDWYAKAEKDQHILHAFDEKGGFGIDLTLSPGKGAVLHGENGYHWKGVDGIPSYYITYPRMDVKGNITLALNQIEVSGRAWMDHEYTSFKPKKSIRGWDWFAIGLENGFDVMLYQMHHIDGATSTDSTGTLISPESVTSAIVMPDYEIETTDTWTSPRSGAKYPAAWKITLAKIPAVLKVNPILADQEMTMKNSDVIYWEGACDVTGTWGKENKPVQGMAYVELTGYVEPVAQRF